MLEIFIGILAGICTGIGLRRRLYINIIAYTVYEF